MGRQRRVRPVVAQGLVAKLKEVNAAESAAFGRAITSAGFFEVQLRRAQERGKGREAWLWWTMAKVVPLVSRL